VNLTVGRKYVIQKAAPNACFTEISSYNHFKKEWDTANPAFVVKLLNHEAGEILVERMDGNQYLLFLQHYCVLREIAEDEKK
jgi:hypothetical protein